MLYRAFQDLYQHIKREDPRLFETLDRINTYLRDLIAQSNIGQTEPLSADNTAGLTLTTVYQLIPGMALRLATPGWWVVNVSFGVLAYGLDTYINVMATYGAGTLNTVGGLQLGTIMQVSSAGVGNIIMMGSKSWRIQVASPIIIQVHSKKLGGTGASIITSGSMIAEYVG